jgi:hypothetical protein
VDVRRDVLDQEPHPVADVVVVYQVVIVEDEPYVL